MKGLLYLLALSVSLAVLANAVSGLLTDSNPILSLSFNPLNNDARVNQIASFLDGDDPKPEIARIHTVSGNKLHPADARYLSLRGVAEEFEGNARLAQRYYEHSLKLLPTEIQALYRTIRFATVQNDFETSLHALEMFGRRWPTQISLVVPFMKFHVRNSITRKQLIERYASFDRGSKMLSSTLLSADLNPDVVSGFARDFSAQNKNWWPTINKATEILISKQEFSLAVDLFRSVQRQLEFDLNSEIHNGNFLQPMTGNPFDWQIIRQNGVEFSGALMDRGQPEIESKKNETSGLEIQFQNLPVKFRNVSQLFLLEQGSYKFSIKYTLRNFRGPKPVRAHISCFNGNTVLLDTALSGGRAGYHNLIHDFNIQANQCELFRLQFYNGSTGRDWRERYSGSIEIHDVHLARSRKF